MGGHIKEGLELIALCSRLLALRFRPAQSARYLLLMKRLQFVCVVSISTEPMPANKLRSILFA